MTYSVGDFLHRLDVITRYKLVISVEEFDARFLERALGEQETFDTGQACKANENTGEQRRGYTYIHEDCRMPARSGPVLHVVTDSSDP